MLEKKWEPETVTRWGKCTGTGQVGTPWGWAPSPSSARRHHRSALLCWPWSGKCGLHLKSQPPGWDRPSPVLGVGHGRRGVGGRKRRRAALPWQAGGRLDPDSSKYPGNIVDSWGALTCLSLWGTCAFMSASAEVKNPRSMLRFGNQLLPSPTLPWESIKKKKKERKQAEVPQSHIATTLGFICLKTSNPKSIPGKWFQETVFNTKKSCTSKLQKWKYQILKPGI